MSSRSESGTTTICDAGSRPDTLARVDLTGNQVDRGRRRAATREKICRAALECLDDAPFRDLAIDDLARRVGLSRSAFYFYFEDKHELLLAVTQEAASELYDAAEKWWHGDGDPEQMIRETLAVVGSIYERYAGVIRAATEVAAYDVEFNRMWRMLIERFIEATADHLDREVSAGRIAQLDTSRCAEAMVWMVERQLSVYVATGERLARDVLGAIASLWLVCLYEPLAANGDRTG